MNLHPRLWAELRRGRTPDLGRRRASIALSLVGMASMVPTALLQAGLIKHVPDPPIRGFDSDKVNRSDVAFILGLPDGPVGLLGFTMNISIAAIGGSDRASELPWVSLFAFAKTVVDSGLSGWLVYRMPTREKAWCSYSIVAFLTNLGLLALALPEAKQALVTLRERPTASTLDW